MDVSVLHIDDCPNWVEATSRLRTALDNLGASDTAVSIIQVNTPEDALRVPFAGSPTILVDGVDLFPNEGRTTDLACRVYQTNGRLAGLPSLRDIEAALRLKLQDRQMSEFPSSENS